MWRPFLMSAAMAVPTVVHPCPNLFWDMEAIVFAGVIAFWFIIFTLFHKQINNLFNYCE